MLPYDTFSKASYVSFRTTVQLRRTFRVTSSASWCSNWNLLTRRCNVTARSGGVTVAGTSASVYRLTWTPRPTSAGT